MSVVILNVIASGAVDMSAEVLGAVTEYAVAVECCCCGVNTANAVCVGAGAGHADAARHTILSTCAVAEAGKILDLSLI